MGRYMAATKILTNAKLLEYTEKYINELLNEYNLFPLINYSYIEHDEPNPDYAGIASWYSSPLTDLGDPSFNPEDLTPAQKKVVIAGVEFEGMLDSARMSIGYQLLYLDNACNPVFENIDVSWLKPPFLGGTTLFCLHLNNALITLNIASDRVRELFLVLLEMEGIEYCDKNHNGSKAAYSKPFKEARSTFQISEEKSAAELKTQLDKAARLSQEVQGFREYRNKVVHEVGSQNARLTIKLLDTPYRTEEEKISTYEYNEELLTKHEQEKKDKIIFESKKTIDWYGKLVELVNCVFWIESLIRKNAKE